MILPVTHSWWSYLSQRMRSMRLLDSCDASIYGQLGGLIREELPRKGQLGYQSVTRSIQELWEQLLILWISQILRRPEWCSIVALVYPSFPMRSLLQRNCVIVGDLQGLLWPEMHEVGLEGKHLLLNHRLAWKCLEQSLEILLPTMALIEDMHTFRLELVLERLVSRLEERQAGGRMILWLSKVLQGMSQDIPEHSSFRLLSRKAWTTLIPLRCSLECLRVRK